MSFLISGLDPTPFLSLYGLSDDELRAKGVRRYVADAPTGFPDRIELRDVDPGETLLLLNYTHQPADTPYRASHAIFVREGATEAYRCEDVVPAVLKRRLISLRAFDANHDMVAADVVDGEKLGEAIEAFFKQPDVDYMHAHYAKRGCYAARVDRSHG
ncbi:uncharacterized protein DUF1203 [Luteibacter rhizovicinus]|uniref:Uncharacterized protein DUF1203 n=1 Tax=Luteibacter rhizovicinus TaxID=242606 RepID=A0A4R3YPK1_9GAMM|nr:DUF1203 domain-containing protein [Luteibacter rhizovicinus]TCV92843.1 uncharacterized protein DUF1203 [Luteibacter rhizovicinus]